MTTPATATHPPDSTSMLGELTRVVLAPAADLPPGAVSDAGQIAALLIGPQDSQGHPGYQAAHATATQLITAAGHHQHLQQSLDATRHVLTDHAALEALLSIAAGACLAIHAQPLGLPGLDYATLLIPWACLTRLDC